MVAGAKVRVMSPEEIAANRAMLDGKATAQA